MSLLGQKRTFAVHKPMSDLHPKADIRRWLVRVSACYAFMSPRPSNR
jgi:hypothetical protein